jgi:putative transposase
MKKRHSSEQIVKMLREAEAKVAGGRTVEEVCREMGVSEATYYKWRKSYGQMKVDQVKRLRDLEKENGRLKKLVADLSLDKAILQGRSRENIEPDAATPSGGACDATPGGFAASGVPGIVAAAWDTAV